MQERLRNQEVASRLAGDSLDPLGHVHGVADHRELELAIPSEDADEHLAVVPADADPHRRLAGPLAMLAPARDGIEDAMTALNGPRRVVRPLLHRAEHDKDRKSTRLNSIP